MVGGSTVSYHILAQVIAASRVSRMFMIHCNLTKFGVLEVEPSMLRVSVFVHDAAYFAISLWSSVGGIFHARGGRLALIAWTKLSFSAYARDALYLQSHFGALGVELLVPRIFYVC